MTPRPVLPAVAPLVGEVVIPLPWTRAPLSQNNRGAWQGKHSRNRRAIEEAAEAIRATDIPPVAGADVVLHMWPTTRHRRDADNLAPTLKSCLDALVGVGILRDDSWVEVPFSGHRIHAPTKTPPHGTVFALVLTPPSYDAEKV